MELKLGINKDFSVPSQLFKSHLYGIEIEGVLVGLLLHEGFKSHLYGIEMLIGAQKDYLGLV